MRTIFFGTPDFAVPSLRALLESGEEVIAVVTQPDKAKGRGHTLSMPPVKEFALSEGIPVYQPPAIRSEDFYHGLALLSPDVITVVAYGKIIPPPILRLPGSGCINVHASLLPKYRGAAPVQWAIIKGEKKTGVTTMVMDEGLDTGDMLLWEETEIKDEDNAETLAKRLSYMGASLLVKTLRGLKNNTIRPIPQTGDATYAPIIRKEHGKVKWSLSAREIFNLVRGTYPWPGAYCFLNHDRLTVLSARVADEDRRTVPGRIEKVEGEELRVGTGRGILSLLEVKPEGKRVMTAGSFAHGRHITGGMSFATQ